MVFRKCIPFLIVVYFIFQPSIFTQNTITIIHINDTHSHLLPWGPTSPSGERQYGGVSRFIFKYKQIVEGVENPLFLHGGDFFTGDYFFNRFLGRGEFELLGALGLCATVPGNHDFDAKPFRLKSAYKNSGASFDIVCANIVYNNDTSNLSSIIKPFVIKTIGELKIGIFGLTTQSTEFYGEQFPISFSNPISASRKMVDTLKTYGVDFIIALSHLGVFEDSSLARQVNDIDVIVGGHSHTALYNPIQQRNPDGDTTLILQAGAYYQYIGKLTLSKNSSQRFWSYQLEEVNYLLPEDAEFSAKIQTYKDSIENVYGKVYSDTIGILLNPFPQFDYSRVESNFEHSLYNLITDSYLKFMMTDAAIEIPGLAQKSLYSNLITPNDIRQMFGWSYDSKHNLGKKLSRVEITGGFLKQLLRFALSFSSNILGSNVVIPIAVSGVQYTIDLGTVPAGLGSVWINGEPINEGRIYSLAMNEFTADLILRVLPFNPFINRKDTTYGPADALALYIKSLNEFSPMDIQMGRVWEKSRIQHISFSFFGKYVQLNWTNSMKVQGYNIYRKTKNDNVYIKINNVPLTISTFVDSSLSSDGNAYYQLEEIRSDGYRYIHPPVLYDANLLPQQYSLQQNYPNPFNNFTNIPFAVAATGGIKLRILNLMGEEVKVLINEERVRADYIEVWDGTNSFGENVSSGVYFVQLIVKDFVGIRPIVLVK